MGVEDRDLEFRWGSGGRAGNVNFHWATILLPPGILDYVIVHELTHLIEPNHTPKFWRRVRRALPEYEQSKTWPAAQGGRHLVLEGHRMCPMSRTDGVAEQYKAQQGAQLPLSGLARALVIARRVTRISSGASVACPHDYGRRPVKHQCLRMAGTRRRSAP